MIVRTDRIGDVVLTLPMARVIRNCFPGSEVAMLIRSYTAEIVGSGDALDLVLTIDDESGLKPLLRLTRMIRHERFDAVIHTHPIFRLALVTWLAGIPVRVGTGYRWYSFLFNRRHFEHRKDARFHELEYNLHLLDSLGCTTGRIDVQPKLRVDPAAEAAVRKLLRDSGVQEGERFVIIHPGSGGSARDWSAENFGRLAGRLIGAGIRVIVTGISAERPLVARVVKTAGNGCVELVGVLTMKEYIALSARASAFVGNSTGPIHIAAAVGTPVVGLYPQITALNATRWGPYTGMKTVFSPSGKPTDCTHCRNAPEAGCECMDSIQVGPVFDAVIHYCKQVTA